MGAVFPVPLPPVSVYKTGKPPEEVAVGFRVVCAVAVVVAVFLATPARASEPGQRWNAGDPTGFDNTPPSAERRPW